MSFGENDADNDSINFGQKSVHEGAIMKITTAPQNVSIWNASNTDSSVHLWNIADADKSNFNTTANSYIDGQSVANTLGS